ncbi:GNAT family N-acetyltransferase [Dactylosporangium sp. NBC_01737]|uniref:GNAT family N-acetyltransferase n=1 Tax=Dactylosporangium sp. NBC_01737 TaxID=2975959 RepID=UPI002E15CFF4|nr:GNAT family N-acetyltransferase [Dactylosporangium sp. NBC_01737]
MTTGQLVRLRPIEPEEWEALWRWNNDRDVMRWMSDGYRQTLARYIARGEERGPNTYGDVLFGIETLVEPRLVGLVRLSGAEPEIGRAELDIYLGEKNSWGHGYATEATRLMCRYGFEEMRLHSIHLWVVTENAAARRVYDKVGFIEDGRHRQCFRRDGEWYDMYLMSLLATDPMQSQE